VSLLEGVVPAGCGAAGRGGNWKVVIGKGKNKINIPTQIISPPLIKGGGI
jgi:hypothetical protein